MLKNTVLGLMSGILNILLLNFKFKAYDIKDNSVIGIIIGTFDTVKDIVVVSMVLWYILN